MPVVVLLILLLLIILLLLLLLLIILLIIIILLLLLLLLRCIREGKNLQKFLLLKKSVYSAVRTGALNKAVCASSLKG